MSSALAVQDDRALSADYFATPGLSQSGMKNLEVSPLRYWHLQINPARMPVEETPAMAFGSALHCAVLESEEAFESRYACDLDPSDYPDALVVMEDLRGWLRSKGVTPKGTRKDEVAAQVRALDPNVLIMDDIEKRHVIQHAGKTMLAKEDWLRIAGCLQALRDEPRICAILKSGRAEVPMFATDPDTGVLLKAKLDWVTPTLTFDLKTFSQRRGSSIDRSVADAIFYEAYYRQAYFYTMVRSLQPGTPAQRPGFVMAFVESEPPHDVRIKSLGPRSLSGEVNVYWERARVETRNLIRLYTDCVERYGDKPWREACDIAPLVDEDIRQIAFS